MESYYTNETKLVKARERLVKAETQNLKEENKPSKKKGVFGGKKFLKKPTIKVEGISAEGLVNRDKGHLSLVREGRSGYFSDEYERELKWL